MAALKNAVAKIIKTQGFFKRFKVVSADCWFSLRGGDWPGPPPAQGSADIDQAKATLEMSRQDLQTVI
ncbi:HlyD family secretion protein, partial [Enterobacter hormaechei]